MTDHIGKPVLMLNSAQQIAGVGEYDPYGSLNHVAFHQETTHSVSCTGTCSLASISQPKVAGLDEEIRAHVIAFDPNCAGYSNVVHASAQFSVPGTSASVGACHVGNYWFPWLASSDGTASLTIATDQVTCPPSLGHLLRES